jgi:hypothetical protein
MAYGSEGGDCKFKHKKIVFVLKFQMDVHWSNVFALQRSFLELQI